MPRIASLASFRASPLLLATASLLTVAACSEVEEGRYGIVDFVPDDCGDVYCSFDDDLAIGATTDVYLSGNDGQYVDDLELVSSNPSVFEVVGRDGGSTPRFTILGRGRGRADLIAVDRRGDEVDYMSLDVSPVDEVEFLVDGVRVVDDVVYEGRRVPRRSVTAGTTIVLVVRPIDRLGDLDHDVALPPALAGRLDPDSDIDDGKVVLAPPAGEHVLLFSTGDGRSWPLMIDAR
jgi:hypothetical protein